MALRVGEVLARVHRHHPDAPHVAQIATRPNRGHKEPRRQGIGTRRAMPVPPCDKEAVAKEPRSWDPGWSSKAATQNKDRYGHGVLRHFPRTTIRKRTMSGSKASSYAPRGFRDKAEIPRGVEPVSDRQNANEGSVGSRTPGLRNFGPVPSCEDEGRAEYPYLATARSNALENVWFGSGSGASRLFELKQMQGTVVTNIGPRNVWIPGAVVGL